MLNLFEVRGPGRLHPVVYRLALGGFALARLWDGGGLQGVARGRGFEAALYRFCERWDLRLSERAGARTLRGVRSASGLRHESDGVIAAPDATVHIETKYLTNQVSKGDLMVFNQKGLDHILAGDPQVCRRPLYRLFLSGSPLSHEARRFALAWGIVAVEPDRLPLPLLHWLAGSSLSPVPAGQPDRVWDEVPRLVVPLQERLRRLSACLDGGGGALAGHRLDAALKDIQEREGERYWSALDRQDPLWLERVYEDLALERWKEECPSRGA